MRSPDGTIGVVGATLRAPPDPAHPSVEGASNEQPYPFPVAGAMTWVKLDDNFTDHPKIDALSDAAFRLHVSALCYCTRHLTDGFVPKAVLSKLTPHPRPGVMVKELVGGGVWDEASCDALGPGLDPEKEGVKAQTRANQDGWQIHDYLDFQEPADEVKARRKRDAERKRSERRKRGLPAETSETSSRTSGRSPSGRPGGQTGDRPAGVRADVQAESAHPDPTRPVPTDVVTPSLTTRLEADEAEGGSGYAEDDHPFEPDDGPTPDDLAPTRRTEPPGLRKVDAALRQVCPPDKNRLYGSPRSDLIAALRAGGDVDLIVAAVKQGDPNEGAFIRANRAIAALRDGKVPTGVGGSPVKPYQAPTWEDDPPTDPTVVADELAKARAAIGR